ncbi:MAG: FG-GAP-like repeat-containing protein [bacterium]|nr:FG-GAP-like repeat-containing protein [bacterium]
MKKYFVLLFLSLFLSNVTYGQRIVVFLRYTIDSVLLTPHGDWAGDVQNDNPVRAYDAFATTAGGKNVAWYSNNSLGTTWGPKNIIYTTSDKMCTEVCAGQLDADNWIDAVSSFVRSDSISYSFLAIHKNNGNGTFTTTRLDSLKTRLRQIRIVDINNDGLRDIIVAGSPPRSSWIQESGVYWYRNNGGMSFTRNFIATATTWKIDAFDNVDGDKHLDIIASEEFFSGQDTSAAARILLFKNNGAEGFSQVIIESNLGRHLGDPPGGGGLRCADFNKDGKVDIVAGSSYNGILYWYKNNDGTSFTRNVMDNNASRVDGIDVGDFDTDGNMDVVACGRNSWIRWYKNNGNETFSMNSIDTQFPLFDLPYVTYLDGDTCPDIVVTEATSTSGWVFAYLNHCEAGVRENTMPFPQYNWLKATSIANNNSVNITFEIKNKSKIKLEAIDITGKVTDVLVNNYYDKGTYTTTWNTINTPNGTYFLSLKSGNNPTVTKRITIVK